MTAEADRDARGPGTNLALATAAFACCFFAWGMIAPIAPRLQDRLSLSDSETAFLIALPVVLGSVLRVPIGLAVDRLRGRSIFAVLLIYAAAISLLVGAADSYPMLLLAALLLGVVGASFVVGVPFVAEWFPANRHGFTLGLYGIGNIGSAAAAFTVPYAMSKGGQMAAGALVATVLGTMAVVWLLFSRNAPQPRKTAPVPYRDVVRYGAQLWRLSLIYFVSFGGFVALAVFLPKLLTDWFDLSLADAGMRAGGFTIIATISRPLGGYLADRFDTGRVLVVALSCVGVDAMGLAWQSTDPSIVPVTVFCLSMAAFFGIGSGAVFKLVPQLFPDATGAVTGVVGAIGGLGGFFPPLVMGAVHEATGHYTIAFVLLMVFALVCATQATKLVERGVAGVVSGVAR